MRLGHNIYSLQIFKNYKNTLVENSKALGNISTGIKLNSAKDNPNKIAQSDNLKFQILARNAAQSNIQDTTSMLQTFDGALQEMNNNVSRLNELTVRAANETNNDSDRAIIQKEINQILMGIDDLRGIELEGNAGIAVPFVLFNDIVIYEIFKEWKKMSDLLESNIIDDEIFDLWVEKTLIKYNKSIDEKNQLPF